MSALVHVLSLALLVISGSCDDQKMQDQNLVVPDAGALDDKELVEVTTSKCKTFESPIELAQAQTPTRRLQQTSAR